jgi:hypothetical protein
VKKKNKDNSKHDSKENNMKDKNNKRENVSNKNVEKSNNKKDLLSYRHKEKSNKERSRFKNIMTPPFYLLLIQIQAYVIIFI